MIVNIHEVKSRFLELLQKAEAGEDIIICRAGRPTARLTQYRGSPGPRIPGGWKGRVRMSSDFDRVPDEFVDKFPGSSDSNQ